MPPRQDSYGNSYPPNGPYAGPPGYRPDQGGYPPYSNYQNSQGYNYPPNQGYNQNYDNNYYQQQPPYGNNYPNQYPQNNPEGYNQNYWGNSGYYGTQGYYNNPQYPNSQPPQEYRGSGPASPAPYPNNPSGGYNNPPHYTGPQSDQPYPGNAIQPYSSQEAYANQRPPYQGYQQPGFSEFNSNAPGPYPNTPPTQEYTNNQYGPPPYANNAQSYGPNQGPYNQYDNAQNYPGFSNHVPPNENPNNITSPSIKTEPSQHGFPTSEVKTEAGLPPNVPTNMEQNVQSSSIIHNNMTGGTVQHNVSPIGQNVPPMAQNIPPGQYGNPVFEGFTENTSFPNPQENDNSGNYPNPYPNFPSHLETKPPLGSASSGSPLASWPITELKTEVDKLKAEEKAEIKSESDGEVKIADLDTKKIVKDESKKPCTTEAPPSKDTKYELTKPKYKEGAKSDGSETEEEIPKKPKRGRPKAADSKKGDKAKAKNKAKPKGRKDRKTSKEKNDESESEESEKEEKMNREEELAMVKKAEEMTYDWAAELLKDYIPGIIENSAKMELFFYILNESIKMGDRLLLFSQSLFTLNLIEDFLERNYIPGTNCVWERNTNYYSKYSS